VDLILLALLAHGLQTPSVAPRARLTVVLTVCFMLLGFVRLMIDFPIWRTNAIRDFTLPLECGYLLVGYWTMRRYGVERWTRALAGIFLVGLPYLLAYPFRDAIVAISPTVGLQRAVPLFGNYSAAGT